MRREREIAAYLLPATASMAPSTSASTSASQSQNRPESTSTNASHSSSTASVSRPSSVGVTGSTPSNRTATSNPSSSLSSSSRSATITYSGSQSFLNSQLCNHALKALESQLPLRNLHWRPTIKNSSTTSNSQSSTQIRTIQTLPVKLTPLTQSKSHSQNGHRVEDFDGNSDLDQDHHPSSLLSKPLVNIYFVTTQDGDYRSTIRSDIRSWLAALQSGNGNGQNRSDSLNSNHSSSNISNSRPSTPNQDPIRRTSSPIQMSPSHSSSSATMSIPDSKPEYLIVLLSSQVDPTIGGSSGTASGNSSEAPKPTGVSRFYSKNSNSNTSSNSANSSSGNLALVDAGAASVLEKMRSDFAESTKEAASGAKGVAAVAKRER